MKFLGVTILQGVEFPIFPIHFAWALQQQRYCAACDDGVAVLLDWHWASRKADKYTSVVVRAMKNDALLTGMHHS